MLEVPSNTRKQDPDTRTLSALVIALFASLAAPAAQSQSADDTKWIAQCMRDNKDEGAKTEVVRKHCVCMNDKMDVNESRPISQWEKQNPKAMKECEKQAGWK